MKGQKLAEYVSKRYSKIDKTFRAVMSDFAVDDIHLFRVEVKRLKSLIGLASADCRRASALKLPARLEAFYVAVGAIRSLQLQRQNMEGVVQLEYASVKQHYLDYVVLETDKQIERAKKIAPGRNPFAKGARKMLKQLPVSLTDKSIHAYVKKKYKSLASLMEPEFLSDESIHAGRKVLKNLLYSWKLTKGYDDPSCTTLKSKEEIKMISETFGRFQDQCITLDLMQTHYKVQQIDGAERIEWRRLEGKWWNKKERTRALIRKHFQNESMVRDQPHQIEQHFVAAIKKNAIIMSVPS